MNAVRTGAVAMLVLVLALVAGCTGPSTPVPYPTNGASVGVLRGSDLPGAGWSGPFEDADGGPKVERWRPETCSLISMALWSPLNEPISSALWTHGDTAVWSIARQPVNQEERELAIANLRRKADCVEPVPGSSPSPSPTMGIAMVSFTYDTADPDRPVATETTFLGPDESSVVTCTTWAVHKGMIIAVAAQWSTGQAPIDVVELLDTAITRSDDLLTATPTPTASQ